MKNKNIFFETLGSEYLFLKLQDFTKAKRFWVGYSGGVDSEVLLNLAAKVFENKSDYQLGAIHIHHGLSEHADVWLEHCKMVCARLQIPLEIFWVNAKVTDGESPEEVARIARFKAFRDFIKSDECLLLAHHAEDQAETILMRLFRGAGPSGLSGMAEKMQMDHYEIIRPLLTISKKAIQDYAVSNALQWIQDDSNHNLRFDRNFLRSEIIPRLKERWPQVLRSINRSGELCLEAANAVHSMAAGDWQGVIGKLPGSLSVKALLKLETARRSSVIRYWLQMQQYSLPSRAHMERIDKEVLCAKPGARPQLKIAHYRISRQSDELIVETCEMV